METWKHGKSYAPGTVVLHEGKVYRKDADGDDSPPDAVPGGWSELPNTNLSEFLAIEASFTSYEERKAKHQAEVRKKLAAAGLAEADVLAVLSA
jgi:hypothetical protein